MKQTYRKVKILKKVGVIPYQIIDGEISILMVTSMGTGRWILPKGNLKTKESHKKGCLREAFEEAGVEGKILKNFPMTMVMAANERNKTGQIILKTPVVFYPMRVKNEAKTWPEKKQRQRKWITLDKALDKIKSKDISSVLKHFKTLTPWLIDAKQ